MEKTIYIFINFVYLILSPKVNSVWWNIKQSEENREKRSRGRMKRYKDHIRRDNNKLLEALQWER
jgi:hypothetical protein